jgi:processive 1,2-diacylglycerol beta-glucosyltransferase
VRVYVAAVPFGGGHRAVADALAMVLSRVSDDADVTVVDALDLVSKRIPLAPLGAKAYLLLTRSRALYRFLFALVDRYPLIFGRVAERLFGRRARRWLRAAQADVFVSTFPLVSWVVGEAIAATGSSTRLVTMVTDGGRVNSSWFSGRAEAVLVSDDDTRLTAERLLPPSTPVHQISLPLRPSARPSLSQELARKLLGLPAGPVILVWGGAFGMARGVPELARALLERRDDMAAVFAVGTNRKLQAKLQAFADPGRVLIVDQRADVATLLSAADVVLGKPGWISLAEAEAAGLHTICYDTLPGQELENLRVSCMRGTATWEPNPARALDCARTLVQSAHRAGRLWPQDDYELDRAVMGS